MDQPTSGDIVLPGARTESGRALTDLAEQAPTLLVFLRHWGCPFCRRLLSDLARLRPAIEAQGVQLVFVHMGTPERARPYFEHYGLADIERISDPEQSLYRHPIFALRRKPLLRHVLDVSALAGVFRGIIWKHGMELHFREDPEQMPGAFLLRDGSLAKAHRPRSIADQPDWLRFIR